MPVQQESAGAPGTVTVITGDASYTLNAASWEVGDKGCLILLGSEGDIAASFSPGCWIAVWHAGIRTEADLSATA